MPRGKKTFPNHAFHHPRYNQPLITGLHHFFNPTIQKSITKGNRRSRFRNSEELNKGQPLGQSSKLREMEERVNMHHRRLRSAALLCCCCFGSDDSAVERSLLKPSWLQKVARSNSGPEAAAMDLDSPKWWRKGWNSVRRAGEWSETVVEEYAGGCCSRPKWKNFVRRCKADGRSIYSTRPSRFHYDQMDYQLNFDEGGFQGQGLSDSRASSKHFKGEAGSTAAL